MFPDKFVKSIFILENILALVMNDAKNIVYECL